MTKKEIVKTISDKTGIPQIQIKEIVQLTLDGIVETLLQEGRVEIRDFGVFQVKSRKARTARNPRTGLRLDVPEKFTVAFKPGKEMEALVAEAHARKAGLEGGDSSSSDPDDEASSGQHETPNTPPDKPTGGFST